MAFCVDDDEGVALWWVRVVMVGVVASSVCYLNYILGVARMNGRLQSVCFPGLTEMKDAFNNGAKT